MVQELPKIRREKATSFVGLGFVSLMMAQRQPDLRSTSQVLVLPQTLLLVEVLILPLAPSERHFISNNHKRK